MRQLLQHKYKAPLAQLGCDEDSFILQKIKEKKANDEKAKALKKKKGRSAGPNVKKKVNEALSDMSFSLTISSATNGAEVFTLKNEQEEVIELTAEEEKSSAMVMPEVPRT